jgi:hypothetical protein
MVCVTLILVSGLANFALFQAPSHKGQPLYHALFGIKFLAALVVFFLASALTGRSASLAPIRANARFWAGVAATLVIVIVAISASCGASRALFDLRRGVEIVPPGRPSLEPPIEPREDRARPDRALRMLDDVVVLALDGEQLDGAPTSFSAV